MEPEVNNEQAAAATTIFLEDYIKGLQEVLRMHGNLRVVRRPVHWRVSNAEVPEVGFLLNQKVAKKEQFWISEVHKEEQRGEAVVEV